MCTSWLTACEYHGGSNRSPSHQRAIKDSPETNWYKFENPPQKECLPSIERFIDSSPLHKYMERIIRIYPKWFNFCNIWSILNHTITQYFPIPPIRKWTGEFSTDTIIRPSVEWMYQLHFPWNPLLSWNRNLRRDIHFYKLWRKLLWSSLKKIYSLRKYTFPMNPIIDGFPDTNISINIERTCIKSAFCLYRKYVHFLTYRLWISWRK